MLSLSTRWPRDASRPHSAIALSNSPHSEDVGPCAAGCDTPPNNHWRRASSPFSQQQLPLPPPTLLQTVTDGGSCNTFFISMFCTARQAILGSALRSFTPTFYGYSLRFAPLDVVSCAKAPGVSPLAAPRQRQLQPAPSTIRLTQAMLQVDTFEELLSHVFGGCVLKAATPRQHRMGVNLRSYQSRAWEIARYLASHERGR